MSIQIAIEIQLDVWKNPQGNLIHNVSERECHVYFGCWNEDSSPADYIGKLTFKGCCATKFIHSEFLPYKVEEYKHHSSILKVNNSEWVKELALKKKANYPNSQLRFEKNHYIVQGHDVFVEVIAEDFVLERLYREQAGEYARLIDEA